MVDKVNRSGWRDWLVQRVTAVLLAIYTIFIIIYLLTAQPISYASWHQLFSHFSMKIFTLIVVVSLLWHAWIGLWTVFTDYVKNRPTRFFLQTIVILLLLVYLVWTFEILWLAHLR
jgi:succinate dehydrogenase / fumarate reductase membrane anchor subunit